MATFNTFEEIIAWQKAKELTLIIYACYKGCRDFSFRDQIRRAAVSIMNNIAEGYERRSNKELTQFLYISKGSAGEVRSMNYLGFELKYIGKEDFENIHQRSLEIARILSGLIRSLK